MAQKNTSGTNSVPRLVVKIIGSKQVKQFIEEPQEDEQDSSGREAENPPVAAADEGCEEPPDVPGVMASRSDSGLWAGINQVPDRLCVTAPSGDRSRSYIHPKTRHHGPEGRAAEPQQTTEQRGELASAVREELRDWQLSSFRSVEEEVAALHASSSSSSSSSSSGGTVDRWEITGLFLKHDVPLTFPTFSLLLQMFSDEKDPVQVHYRNLLRFIQTSAFPEELHGGSQSS